MKNVSDILPVLLFSAAGATLMVVNKLCVRHLPLPSLLCSLQLGVSAGVAAVMVRSEGATFELRKAQPLVLFVGLFACTLYTSMVALQVASIEMVLVMRACCPVLVAVLESICLGARPPSLRGGLSLAMLFACALAYVGMHTYTGALGMTLATFAWLAAYLTFDVTSVLVGKSIAHGESMGVWERVLYTNVMGVPPLLGMAALTGETAEAPRFWAAHAQGDAALFALVGGSCALGLAISYFGWRTRSLLGASSFATLSFINKLITLLLGVFIFQRHETLPSMALVLLCLLFCCLYMLDSATRQPDEVGARHACHAGPSLTRACIALLLLGVPVALLTAPPVAAEGTAPGPAPTAAGPFAWATDTALAESAALAEAAAPVAGLRVLVTGGTGLLGHAVRRAVAHNRGWAKTEFVFAGSRDADLTDRNATRALLARVRPDAILHLAANVGGLYKNLASPINALEDNMAMGINLLHAADAHGVKTVRAYLYPLSFPGASRVYPTQTHLPFGSRCSRCSLRAYSQRWRACRWPRRRCTTGRWQARTRAMASPSADSRYHD